MLKKFGVIAAVILIVIITARGYLSIKEHKAIRIAKEYLAKKYEEPMQYESIRFSWIDPSLYHVWFSPIANSEIIFQVLIQKDLTILEYGKDHSAENYYLSYFTYLMNNYFSPIVYSLWDNNAEVNVILINQGLYAFSIPSGFNSNMTLEEMEPLFGDYWILITANAILDNSSIENEARKIFELIQIVKNSNFTPDNICYDYYSTEKAVAKKEYSSINFNSWSEISSIDQLIKEMEINFK